MSAPAVVASPGEAEASPNYIRRRARVLATTTCVCRDAEHAAFWDYWGVGLFGVAEDPNRDLVDPEQDFQYALDWHPSHHVFFRKFSCDDQFFSERRYHGLLGLRTDDLVLDLGGNAGLFTTWALRPSPHGGGAAACVVVEPDLDNQRLVRLNVGRAGLSSRVLTVDAAVVPDAHDEDYVPFYLNFGKGRGMHTLHPRRGRHEVHVPAVRWSDLLAFARPTVVKVDIEGGEYLLADELSRLPNHVRAVSVELHVNNSNWRPQAWALRDALLAQFTPTWLPDVQLQGQSWMARFVGVR